MIRPVILCGGAGTRLWPLSRQLFPKQLLSLFGGQSLLQQTAKRLTGEEFARPIIVSGEDQHIFIKRQLDEIGALPDAILLEPIGRNTAAAAALAAVWLNAAGCDELLLLMPSDHVILDVDAFIRAISIAAHHARAGAIVTFGAQPTEPNTQYGYIEAGDDDQSGYGALPIARFVEKPNAEKAAEYLATGRFYWNAGIFLVSQRTLTEEMRRFLPDSLNAIEEAIANATTDGVFVRPEAVAFERAENISIDHAIMEKTSRGTVVPVQMGWSDVGSWDAVWKLGEKDTSDNVTDGDVIALDTRRSLLRSDQGGPLICTIGLNEMAVIAVGDAVLVSPLNHVGDVKQVVESLRRQGRNCVVSHPVFAQSWGSEESFAQKSGFEVKHIAVEVGETLPLKKDVHHVKHWVIVQGSAEVTLGDHLSILRESESICVPPGVEHRLANRGEVPMELIEVVCGSSLSEDGVAPFEGEDRRASGPQIGCATP